MSTTALATNKNINVTALDLVLASFAVNQRIPQVYAEMERKREITSTHFEILENLFRYSFDKITEVMTTPNHNKSVSVAKYGGSTTVLNKELSSITSRPFRDALYRLEKLGLVKLFFNQHNRIIGLELSPDYFVEKMKTIMFKRMRAVSLAEVLYPSKLVGYAKNFIGDLFITRVQRVCKKFKDQRNPEYYYYHNEELTMREEKFRQPIITHDPELMLESIKPCRVPINEETWIRQRDFREIMDNKKKPRKINFSAKKYAGLNEAQKSHLEDVSKFGTRFVDTALQRYIDQANNEFSEDDTECLKTFIPYYEKCVMFYDNRLSYSALNNKIFPKSSKYWNSLFKAYSLCKENGWDYKQFLECQFESSKFWEHRKTIRYPMPNMLYTERAIVAFYSYLNNIAEVEEKTGRKHSPVKNLGLPEEELFKRMELDFFSIKEAIKYSRNKYCTVYDYVDLDKYHKENVATAKEIMDRWDSTFSIEFLSQIKGIKPLVEERLDILYRSLDDKTKELKRDKEMDPLAYKKHKGVRRPKTNLELSILSITENIHKFNDYLDLLENKTKLDMVKRAFEKLEEKHGKIQYVELDQLEGVLNENNPEYGREEEDIHTAYARIRAMFFG